MKILIISYYFSPGNIIGAVRASKLSKYFDLMGYEVDVICSEENKLLFMPYDIKEDETLIDDTKDINKIRVSHSKIYKYISNSMLNITKKVYGTSTPKTQESSNNLSTKLTNSAIKFFAFLLKTLQDFDFLLRCKTTFNKNEILKYDVVLSTYGPLSSHLVGNYMKRKNKNILWIADFRDPIAQPANGLIEYKINKYFEKIVCKNANIITAVSKGYLDEVANQNKIQIKKTITNGFDEDDLKRIEFCKQDSFFSFVYTGTTYAGRRDLQPIFKVLRELIDENVIKKDDLIFRYAGPEKLIIAAIAEQYQLESILECSDSVPRIDALRLQLQSKFLLVSTWNESHHTGVLPGKFLEYMMFKKPIIAIVSGTEEGSEIGEIINDYKIGICYEKVNHKKDFELLKKYVKEQYEYYCLNDNKIIFQGDYSKISMHSYKNITIQYSDLIEDSTKQN